MKAAGLRVTTLFLLFVVPGCGSDAPPPSAELEAGVARSADGVPISYDVRGSANPAIILVHSWANPGSVLPV